jgi:hypothetical protein
MKFHDHYVNRWAHVSFWFWKKLNFLHFLPCKEIILCMCYLKDYQLQWISFWLKFTLVMKFHDRQSSERCIRKLISRHCLDKTRTRWNDFLFLITDDRDLRPQTCTNGLVFTECKHIKNIFADAPFRWLPIMKFHHQRKQASTCIILVLKEVKFLAFLALQRN